MTTCCVGDEQKILMGECKPSNSDTGPHCQQQFYWATAEPVRANTKGTRQAAKSEEHKHSQPDPLFRPCEADAVATHAAALAAAQNQPVHQADWDINVAGFPIANFFDW